MVKSWPRLAQPRVYTDVIVIQASFLEALSQDAVPFEAPANRLQTVGGRLVRDKNTREPRLTCRNWECGVILPVVELTIKAGSEQHSTREDNYEASLGMDIFVGQVPVPMQVPGSQYGPRRPWFFMDH